MIKNESKKANINFKKSLESVFNDLEVDLIRAEKVITNLAVLEVTKEGFKLLERAPGVSVEEIIAATEAKLIIEGNIAEMGF